MRSRGLRTDPGGFSDGDLRLFQDILPTYSTVVEVKSLRRFATNVLSTYVGREPGELIMNGQIRRGDVRTIRAALMMVDLRDFTSLSDTLPPSEVIETLNRYFDGVIPPIKRRGGEVLEFLGDGILAILHENGEHSAREACKLAFEAAGEGLDALSALHHELSTTPPHLKAGFALHYGEVSYGNIGAGDRLDFTVIGPDVNLTSRIERLCRELDRNLIMSEEFVRYLDAPKLFIRQRFGQSIIDLDIPEIEKNIEHTRFPVPEDESHQSTADYPGLLRAADLIGQLADINYL